jgi:uncharacterized protein (TIRG00374 family)
MKRVVYYILSLITSAVALILLIHVAGSENLSNVIKHISAPLLLLSLGVYGTSWVFRTMRLSLFVNQNETSIRQLSLFKMNISGFALNNISPARLGDAATIGYLRMYGVRGGRSTAIIVQTRVLDLLSIIFLALCGIIFSLESSFPSWIIRVIFICGILCLLPYCVVWSQKIHGLPERLRRFAEGTKSSPIRYITIKASDIYQAYSDIVYNRRLFFVSVFYSVLVWTIEGLSCYIIARATGADLPLAIVLSAVALANIGKGAPVTPGGIGVYESIMVTVLSLQGCPVETSLVIALCDHLLKKGFTITIGIPATLNIAGYNLSRLRQNLKTPLAEKNGSFK